jgi:hypothetical protein
MHIPVRLGLRSIVIFILGRGMEVFRRRNGFPKITECGRKNNWLHSSMFRSPDPYVAK